MRDFNAKSDSDRVLANNGDTITDFLDSPEDHPTAETVQVTTEQPWGYLEEEIPDLSPQETNIDFDKTDSPVSKSPTRGNVFLSLLPFLFNIFFSLFGKKKEKKEVDVLIDSISPLHRELNALPAAVKFSATGLRCSSLLDSLLCVLDSLENMPEIANDSIVIQGLKGFKDAIASIIHLLAATSGILHAPDVTGKLVSLLDKTVQFFALLEEQPEMMKDFSILQKIEMITTLINTIIGTITM